MTSSPHLMPQLVGRNVGRAPDCKYECSHHLACSHRTHWALVLISLPLSLSLSVSLCLSLSVCLSHVLALGCTGCFCSPPVWPADSMDAVTFRPSLLKLATKLLLMEENALLLLWPTLIHGYVRYCLDHSHLSARNMSSPIASSSTHAIDYRKQQQSEHSTRFLTFYFVLLTCCGALDIDSILGAIVNFIKSERLKYMQKHTLGCKP